MANKVQDISL